MEYEKICERCNKSFKTIYKVQKYCCEFCRLKKEKICLYCKERFLGIRKQKFCCKECAHNSRRVYLDIPECLDKADRKLDKNLGYIRVYCPMHPNANSWGYVYEHRLIVEQRIGRYLEKGEHVHHKNGIRWDNSEENLEHLSSSEHSKIPKGLKIAGMPQDYDKINKVCLCCAKIFNTDINQKCCSEECDLKYKELLEKRNNSLLPIQKTCEFCNKEFTLNNTQKKTQKFCSSACSKLGRRKVPNRPNKVELQKLLWEKPTVHIAKYYKVTDKAIEKWARQYNIEKPPRGYWAKKGFIKKKDIS